MVVSRLSARVFAVADDRKTRGKIDVLPEQRANLVLTHRGGHCELDEPPDRNRLSRIAVTIRNDAVEFIVRGPTVALITFADEPQPSQCHAGQHDLLGRNLDAVYCSGVDKDGPNVSYIYADGNGTGALLCA